MTTYSFYDPVTGAIDPTTITCPASQAVGQRPGLTRIEGHLDHLSQRVDPETGAPVDYQPPQPSLNHEWDAPARRWRLTDTAKQAELRRAAAQARIQQIESKQMRALREMALGKEGAAARLARMDDEIAALRPDLT